jgi:hypothetical protein
VPNSPTNLLQPIINVNQSAGTSNSLVNHVWLQNKNKYFMNIHENNDEDKEPVFPMLDAFLLKINYTLF